MTRKEAIKRFQRMKKVNEKGCDVAMCSFCGSEVTLEYPYDNYCPNCGMWIHGKVDWK